MDNHSVGVANTGKDIIFSNSSGVTSSRCGMRFKTRRTAFPPVTHDRKAFE